jgi:hypothetical protein
MGATDFVKRLLGKPVMVDGADYCYEDEWSEVPQADFRPMLAEANSRVLAMAPESLAELDADLLTEDGAESADCDASDEDEWAWQVALASARAEALQSSQAPEPARPVAASLAPTTKLPRQSPARRTARRASLSDPVARASLAHAKAPVAAPVRLSPAKAEVAEITAVASPRRRREPTQQLVSRPTAVLVGPEVRRVDAAAATEAAPAPAAAAPAPARLSPLDARRAALFGAAASKPAPMASKPAPMAGKPAPMASKPAPMASKPALASRPALASKPLAGKPARAGAVVTEREEDWDAVIARAKRNTPVATPVTPKFRDDGADEWARAMDSARNGGSGPINAEPDWDAALRAAKARC